MMPPEGWMNSRNGTADRGLHNADCRRLEPKRA